MRGQGGRAVAVWEDGVGCSRLQHYCICHRPTSRHHDRYTSPFLSGRGYLNKQIWDSGSTAQGAGWLLFHNSHVLLAPQCAWCSYQGEGWCVHVAGIVERGTQFMSFCGVAGGPCLCLGRWRQVNHLHCLITSSHCGRENEG